MALRTEVIPVLYHFLDKKPTRLIDIFILLEQKFNTQTIEMSIKSKCVIPAIPWLFESVLWN